MQRRDASISSKSLPMLHQTVQILTIPRGPVLYYTATKELQAIPPLKSPCSATFGGSETTGYGAHGCPILVHTNVGEGKSTLLHILPALEMAMRGDFIMTFIHARWQFVGRRGRLLSMIDGNGYSNKKNGRNSDQDKFGMLDMDAEKERTVLKRRGRTFPAFTLILAHFFH